MSTPFIEISDALQQVFDSVSNSVISAARQVSAYAASAQPEVAPIEAPIVAAQAVPALAHAPAPATPANKVDTLFSYTSYPRALANHTTQVFNAKARQSQETEEEFWSYWR